MNSCLINLEQISVAISEIGRKYSIDLVLARVSEVLKINKNLVKILWISKGGLMLMLVISDGLHCSTFYAAIQ